MAGRWTEARAAAWQTERGWRVGCNFAPSTASNQLEMWQAPTFDPETLDRELGFAASLGFTSMRVFLHDIVWQREAGEFGDRIEKYLDIADRHGIATLFVLFDGVWNPHPRAGAQPEPRPRVHNSCWVQGPGADVLADPARQGALEPYVTGVIDRFRDDPRIDGWDLFNEPDNPNFAYRSEELTDKSERACELLTKVFAWARAVDPSQPLTAGVWRNDWGDAARLTPIERLSLDASDIISFHCYGDIDDLTTRVNTLRRYNRPILCTEFMARTAGSTFDPHLGWMKEQGVGAYCWGFAAGRIQTEYGWDSWVKDYTAEPDPWFHDVVRQDGTPYDAAEAAYIRSLTGP